MHERKEAYVIITRVWCGWSIEAVEVPEKSGAVKSNLGWRLTERGACKTAARWLRRTLDEPIRRQISLLTPEETP